MVQYPSMRAELIDTLRTLADAEYQQQAWVKQQFPAGVQFDSFDLAVRLLLDDMRLTSAPQSNIGSVLQNEAELHAVQQVALAINRLLKKLGSELPDAAYLADPDWKNVLHTAAQALSLLEQSP